MRIVVKSNTAGDIRVVAARDKPPRQYQPERGSDLLVYSPILQDSISTGHFALKPGYGWQPNGREFTTTARTRLRELGGIVDATGRERCVFLTGTLPGSTTQAMQSLAQWSAWLVSRLSQWFRDSFDDAYFFGVWEYQKRGALHLHVVVQVSNLLDVTRLKQGWKKRWASLLDGVGKRARADLYARPDGTTWQDKRWKIRTDAQSVEKGVTRYLAKYLSKMRSKTSSQVQLPPSNWWFASQNLRNRATAGRWEMQISNLPMKAALNMYEAIAGWLCASTSVAYPLTNQYDLSYHGVIAMGPPAMAGCLMRELVPLLRTLESSHLPVFPDEAVKWRAMVAYWDARWLH